MKRKRSLVLILAAVTAVLIITPAGFSEPNLDLDDECEDCHSEFEPFTMMIDAPREVPESYDFEYKVVVFNQKDHTLKDLTASFDLSEVPNLKTSLTGGEPYHDEVSGSVGIGGTYTTSFPISEGAQEAIVILDGDEGMLGRNDLDMTVSSPSGQEWSSASSSPDEAVKLDARDLDRGGTGDYNVNVVWYVGNPSISFSISIDVEYGVDQILMEGPDLGPGEKHTFVLPLKSTSKGENTVGVSVTGTAYHEHGDEDDPLTTDSWEYTETDKSQVDVGDKLVYESPSMEISEGFNVLLWERVLGMLSLVLLFVSIGFCGLVRPVSDSIEKMIGGKPQRVRWHCRISLGLLLLSLIHGILLPFSPHARSLTGLALGTISFLLLGALGFIGWQQKPLIKRWGVDRWRNLHLVLTIAVVVIVVLHAVLDGTDFAWLR